MRLESLELFPPASDEHGNVPEGATGIAVGTAVKGRINEFEGSDDTDIFRFEANAGSSTATPTPALAH
jgi:hypothetical protein